MFLGSTIEFSSSDINQAIRIEAFDCIIFVIIVYYTVLILTVLIIFLLSYSAGACFIVNKIRHLLF